MSLWNSCLLFSKREIRTAYNNYYSNTYSDIIQCSFNHIAGLLYACHSSNTIGTWYNIVFVGSPIAWHNCPLRTHAVKPFSDLLGSWQVRHLEISEVHPEGNASLIYCISLLKWAASLWKWIFFTTDYRRRFNNYIWTAPKILDC